MSRRALPQDKILSPLAVEDGFVVGWAFDPGRALLELVLAVDGSDVASGHTGQPIPDTFFALATPPTAGCGFRLPLPQSVRDGRTHRLQVRVREWQSLVKAPKAMIEWYDGRCFGAMSETASGHLSGWVAFRGNFSQGRLPPVEVTEAGAANADVEVTAAGATKAAKGFDIALKVDPRKQIEGCTVVGRFRVERNRFATLRAPVFTCLGRVLEREVPAHTRNVTGEVYGIGPEGLHGWVLDLANPLEQLDLVLVVDGLPIQQFRPSRRLPQLAKQLKLLPEELGICGFHVVLPPVLKDGREHRVEVFCRVDGTRITKGVLVYRHWRGGIPLRHSRGSGNPDRHGLAPRHSRGFKACPRESGDGNPDRHGLAPRHSRESGNPHRRGAIVNGLDSRFRGNDGGARHHPKPQASIIILNRNGAACLDDLFASFLRHNTAAVELIVIDHASTDASLDRIRHWQRHLPIRLEALDRNDSFSASCNRGARLATAPVLLFLNNDIVWLQDALPRILETLDERAVGAVGVRLLKAEFERGTGMLSDANNRPQVQHLGVRFTLSGDQYLPYEVTPDDELLDAQYAPQRIGVVTGAVLACRRKQFLALGGFDEHYHYGIEDVEFCLRLGASAGLHTVCRNDLVALHHHGYTRLTNRESGMLDRQLLNQQRLSDKLGLWLKRAVWQDLLSGGRVLAGETLRIGLAVRSTAALIDGKANAELAAAQDFGAQLQAHWPHCEVMLLAADAAWDYPEDCQLLVALNPFYDLRGLKQARRDLRTACYAYDAAQVATWQANPSLHLYDCCVYRAGADLRKAVATLANQLPLEALDEKAPLANLADATRLRVCVLTAADAAQTPAVTQLMKALRAQGALVNLGTFDENGQRPLQRVCDVHITLFDAQLAAGDPPFVFRRKHDVLDILWVVGGASALRASDLAEADEVWHSRNALPAHLRKATRKAVAMELAPNKVPRTIVQQLRKLVDKKLGRSFHTS